MSDATPRSSTGTMKALADYVEHEQATGCDIKLGDAEAEIIVAVLRGVAQAARVPKVRTSHHRNKEEAARLQKLVDERCAAPQPASNAYAPIDPTNHHNALKCPHCNPGDAVRKAVIEECAKIAAQTAKRCVREHIPGDSVAAFIERAILALSSTDREADDDCACGGGDISGHDSMCPYAHPSTQSGGAAK